MKAKKILNSDIEHILISSLPSHPTAPRAFGGRGLSATEMKEAFDKLPLHIVEEYNKLISDIKNLGDDSLAAAIPTGIKDGHSLHNLFEDVRNGELATYFGILGKSLLSHLITIYAEIDELKIKINEINGEIREENHENTL